MTYVGRGKKDEREDRKWKDRKEKIESALLRSLESFEEDFERGSVEFWIRKHAVKMTGEPLDIQQKNYIVQKSSFDRNMFPRYVYIILHQ